jgi:hypothetical protein
MAIVFDGPVSPDALTTFVRQVPTPGNLILGQFLPDRHFTQNRIDVSELTVTGRTARFRAFDANVHVSRRDAATLRTVKLPPLSDSISVGELERVQLAMAETGGTNMRALINAIYDDATNLTRNVQRRMEQARGDVLLDGKFTLTGEGGLTLEADYGVPVGNFVTAATLWTTTATATPLDDLYTWSYYYNVTAGNGFDPGGMIISRRILNALLSNTAIRTFTGGNILGVPSSVTRQQLDQALDARGVPPILAVYDSQVDIDGTSTRVLPDNKVIFVPPNPEENLGYTAWGITATALELANADSSDLTFEDAPGIVGIVDKDVSPPFRQQTYVDAVGMPVITNPRGLMVATVA